MNKKIKNIFLAFKNLNKKGLILACPVPKRSLWFGALLFFVIFGLVLSSRPALAQVPGFSCDALDLACHIGNFILSVMIKIVVLTFFGMPLLLSTLFVGIMSLILGWIISPDFISLKFTQNPFVDIGLSITQNFANMGFIIFLVAIALATALRIREYQAKKTLPTLILIALLINFSPVFCGFIIDAANIVMNFFLNNITGLTGFVNFLDAASRSIWNLLFASGFDVWANITAAMQVIIMIVFNFFAGFIFILFSALFIMRYIMLWILVILSPIAFVSYILPITRRGQSLLSWRKWWQQLIAWSIIGIIAGFFLYLGFTMISMINVDPSSVVTYPNLSGLGLMNNILPYLIPLVLLWIAYRETRRTSAMFAREIIEMPEKAAKSAVMAAAIAATGGAAMVAAGKLKGAMGTLSSKTKFKEFAKTHPTAARLATPVAKPMQWGRRGIEETIAPTVKEKVEKVPGVATAGRALKAAFWERTKEIRPEEEEIEKRAQGIYKKRLVGKKPGYTHAEIDKMLRDKGITSGTPKATEYMKKWDWQQAEKELTRRVRKPGIIIPTKEITKSIKKGFEEAWKGWQRRSGLVISLKKERNIERIESAIRKREGEEKLTEEELRGFTGELRRIWEEEGREPTLRELRRERDRIKKEVAPKPKPRVKKPPAERKKPPEKEEKPKPKKKPPGVEGV